MRRLVREILPEVNFLTLVPTSSGLPWTLRASDGAESALRFLARFKGRSSVSSSALGAVSEASATRAVTLQAGSNGDGGVSPNAQLVYAGSSARIRGTLLVLRRIVESMSSIRGRKSAILLSEGSVHDPTLVELRELRKLAQRLNAAIDFVDPGGLDLPDRGADEIGHGEDIDDSQGPSDARQQSEGARSLALDTGGRIVQGTNDLLRPLQRIAEDVRTGRVGSVWYAFEVPDPSGFRISTPILTDELRPSLGGSDAPSPVPIARRTFIAAAPLFCAYRLYGAAGGAKG